jgi:hypothetical protein
LLFAEFSYFTKRATPPGIGRIGDDEDIVAAFHVTRCGQVEGGAISTIFYQAAGVTDISQIAILFDVKEVIFGEVYQIVPVGLVCWCVAACIGDGVADLYALPRYNFFWCGDSGHLQIGWSCEQDGQGNGGNVVAFVPVLPYRAGA